jgi:hypothetical protein
MYFNEIKTNETINKNSKFPNKVFIFYIIILFIPNKI